MKALKAEDLVTRCDPGQFSFETTNEITPLRDFTDAIGQPRAVRSLRFGTGIDREGYNIYALGRPGLGKHSLVSEVLRQRASDRPTPSDWCYVNNFEESTKPILLSMPAGQGALLRRQMENFVKEVRDTLKATFESDEYQNRRRSIEQEFKERQQEAFDELQQKAREKNLTVLRTPSGLAFAPVKDGKVVPPEEFHQLPEEERQRVEAEIQNLEQESQRLFQRIPAWERETREKLREMDREVTHYAIGSLVDELRRQFEDQSEVLEYLEAVRKDVVENLQAVLYPDRGQDSGTDQQSGSESPSDSQSFDSPGLRRYRVNVIVGHKENHGAPVVYEDNPTYGNLVGQVEHIAQMGTLVTDFNLIKAGALHRANGGYLILDAHKLLSQPFAWEGLKRALSSNEIKIESLGQMYSMMSTVSLEPQPAPLAVKVVLLGSPLIYYLLRELDPEFQVLFKVAADFDDQMPRSRENEGLYGRLIGTLVQKEGLLPFDRSAVACAIDHSARMVGDSEKLSGHIGSMSNLLREADYWARESEKTTVTASDIQRAMDEWAYRSDRLRERVQEEIERGTLMIDTAGACVGQVNGLSVLQLGDFTFGRPNRITARVRLGKGELIDIEREVALSGPIHSKGVLILAGYLGSRYSQDVPLSLSASLVFEQSYGGIDGDSASSAELCSLLSAIAEIPIIQSFAVTGSVNQHGRVQPIGGVNEKIEGFFEVCGRRGLTGDQGVLIPSANVKHLMLREEVVEAVRDGEFHIYPVETIDEGIQLLTGLDAGKADEDGKFPEESVNGKVQAKLKALAEKRSHFGASGQSREAP